MAHFDVEVYDANICKNLSLETGANFLVYLAEAHG